MIPPCCEYMWFAKALIHHIGFGDAFAPAIAKLGRGDRGIVGRDLGPLQAAAFFQERCRCRWRERCGWSSSAFTIEKVRRRASPLDRRPSDPTVKRLRGRQGHRGRGPAGCIPAGMFPACGCRASSKRSPSSASRGRRYKACPR